jgi:hypothetical protein
MGYSIRYFAGTESVEEGDILTKNSLQVFPKLLVSETDVVTL